jgi:hypothetical protein
MATPVLVWQFVWQAWSSSASIALCMNLSISSPLASTRSRKTLQTMALKGKHNVAEIGGVRCTVIESGIGKERLDFLTDLLTYNGLEVNSEPEKDKEGNILDTFVIGVTDILFNPTVVLYEQKLFRKDGEVVTAAFWEQKKADTEIPYWQVSH